MRREMLVVALAAGVAAPLAAQRVEVVPRDSMRVRQFRIEVPAPTAPQADLMRLLVNRRGRLGVNVRIRASETDQTGAYVEAVTPGGPAARAGIRSGDIITGLGGSSVLEQDREAVADRSMPGLRLVELAARLAPNDSTTIEFVRNGEAQSVTLVTGSDESEQVFVWNGQQPADTPGPRAFAYSVPESARSPMAGALPLDRVEGSPRVEWLMSTPLADVELVPVNPDLGQYFGTTEGILVISVPRTSTLELKGGDVILTIDGRKPTTPAHLWRILRSYEGGETIKFEIMRNRRRETVNGRLPERPNRGDMDFDINPVPDTSITVPLQLQIAPPEETDAT